MLLDQVCKRKAHCFCKLYLTEVAAVLHVLLVALSFTQICKSKFDQDHELTATAEQSDYVPSCNC